MEGPEPIPTPQFDPVPYFPGPQGENNTFLSELLVDLVEQNTHWRRSFPAGGPALPPSPSNARATIEAIAQDLSTRLGRSFPFHSPHYLAHQQNEVQLASMIGLIAGALYNPNNVTVESGLATAELELIACDRVMRMLGYRPPQDPAAATDPSAVGAPAGSPTDAAAQTEISGWFGWSHLSSGGTAANIEALWIARVVRYMPLSIQAAANLPECQGIYLPVQLTMDDEEVDIRSADPLELPHLRPWVALALLEKFTSALIRLTARTSAGPPDPHRVAERAKALLARPEVRAAASHPDGMSGHRPLIFVPRTAHYSLTKAADLLGLGRQSLILVDVDEQFRMSISDLRQKLSDALRSGMIPIAVVAVVGSTEEGSVDPVDDILKLRQEFESGEFAASFWVHVDGAWGAYLASMLATPPLGPPAVGEDLPVPVFANAAAALPQRGKPAGRRPARDEQNQWVSRSLAPPPDFESTWDTDAGDLVSALRAMNRADSITVDPHKLGHVAYPCGLIAFRDDRVRDFIAERAPYITNMHGRSDARRTPVRHRVGTDPGTGEPIIGVASVGPFTLEGSRPGSAATSLWAATQALPLHREAHGAMLAGGLRAARYLHTLLQRRPETAGGPAGFTFVTLTAGVPDTDIVLFAVRPGAPQDPASLGAMNTLTSTVRDALTISLEKGDTGPVTGPPLFLSSTTLDDVQYPHPIVAPFLTRAELIDSAAGYAAEGIVVLRAVVANPYTWDLIRQGHDPIRAAVRVITQAASDALTRT